MSNRPIVALAMLGLLAGCAILNRENSFERAVRAGDAEGIRQAVAAGVDVNRSFLHHSSTIEFLLSSRTQTVTPPIVAGADRGSLSFDA